MSADEETVETVDRLLEEADDLLEDGDDGGDPPGDDELEPVAEEARELFEDVDTAELLDAVGVDVSGAGGPSDLLPALAGADEASLVRFRRLRLLSQVEGDDGSALEEFQALGSVLDEDAQADVDDLEGDVLDADSLDLLGEESGEDVDASDGATGDVDDADDGAADEETEDADVQAEADDAEVEEAADAEADEGDGDLADQAGALTEALDELKERVGSDEGEPEAPAEADGATEQPAPDEDVQDDQARESPDSRRSSGPSSDRADMRIPPRHSTMPK